MIHPEIFWKILLDQWCNKEGHYGLTIPLIICSIRQNTSQNDCSISDLLRQISNSDCKVKISTCSDLGEVILGLFKSTDGPYHYYDHLNNIYYSKEDLGLKIQTIDDLVDFFEKEYGNHIQNGLSSKNYYTLEWTSENEEDRKLIEKVKRRILNQNNSKLT